MILNQLKRDVNLEPENSITVPSYCRPNEKTNESKTTAWSQHEVQALRLFNMSLFFAANLK